MLSWVGSLLKGNVALIVIYDLARVNGGSNYEYTPGQRWFLSYLVYFKFYPIHFQLQHISKDKLNMTSCNVYFFLI